MARSGAGRARRDESLRRLAASRVEERLEDLEPLRRKCSPVLIQQPKLFNRFRRFDRPEGQENGMALKQAQLVLVSVEIGKRELWSLQRLDQPGINMNREWIKCRCCSGLRVGWRRHRERPGCKCLRSFHDLNAVTRRQLFKLLFEAAWPLRLCATRVSRIACVPART